MQFELVEGDVDPESLSPLQIGPKALMMLKLSRWSRGASYQVTKSVIVPAPIVREFLRAAGPPPSIASPPIPQPHTLSAKTRQFFLPLAHELRSPLSEAARALRSARICIRSSMVVDASGVSFAGANWTEVIEPSQAELERAIADQYASMYRAYVDWYLGRAGAQATQRSCALVMSECVEVVDAITASVVGDETRLEFERRTSPTVRHRLNVSHILSDGRLVVVAGGSELPRRTLRRALRALAEVRERISVSDRFEVEFLTDRTDALYVNQVRDTPSAGKIAYALTVQDRERGIVNLLQTPRSLAGHEVLKGGANFPPPAAVACHLSSSDFVDGFGLAWTASTLGWHMPARLVLAYPDAGLRFTHLPYALAEDPSVERVALLPEAIATSLAQREPMEGHFAAHSGQLA